MIDSEIYSNFVSIKYKASCYSYKKRQHSLFILKLNFFLFFNLKRRYSTKFTQKNRA